MKKVITTQGRNICKGFQKNIAQETVWPEGAAHG